MESSFEGSVLDPAKCSKLSLEEKRELVYEVSKQLHGPEMLQSWSRRELLQILCAEMGKERKYTGLTKSKMIEQLLRIVSGKKSVKRVAKVEPDSDCSPINNQTSSKRQRKTANPSRLPIAADDLASGNGINNAIYCQNSACRATVHREDAFCKRCSCCICYQYDDNKDPSLWLVCTSESPNQDNSCGLSCHLECALKHEREGIIKDGHQEGHDGCFNCASCGKPNDLLECWRKQLMIAKDTRRVDILCYRISLSQKLLTGTKTYGKLYEIVDIAVKKLETEVGPLAGLPVKMARGIVNRLSCGPEVQKLCAFAVESLDLMLSYNALHQLMNPMIQECGLMTPNIIRFEDVCPTSLTVVLGSGFTSLEKLVGFNLWHCRADEMDFPEKPTCTLLSPNTRFSVSDLIPATEYLFKVVSFCDTTELGTSEVRFATSCDTVNDSLVVKRSQSPGTNCSNLSNPSSEGDECNNLTAFKNKNRNPHDVIKDLSNSDNTGSGMAQEGSPGDSASALNEERVTGEVGSALNKKGETEFPKDPTSYNHHNRLSDVLNSENNKSPDSQLVEETSTHNGLNSPLRQPMEVVPFVYSSDGIPPVTPCKLEFGKDGSGRNGKPKPSDEEPHNGSGREQEPQADSSSKKKTASRDERCLKDGPMEGDYEYCVKVIRCLECEGHIEKNFRVKFLTWYSLRATPKERRIVKVFVDTLFDDRAGLAGQLVDTFSECISCKRPPTPTMPTGFCTRLWH